MGEQVTRNGTAGDLPLVPARMLNEFVYCPRLFYLEWVQGEFADSADTIEGRGHHRRVDKPGGSSLAEPGEGGQPAEEPDRPRVVRSLTLSADPPGLIARMDLIEVRGDRAVPVDYKRGKAPKIPEGAWDADRVQLCAQGILLRRNGFRCEEGVVYYVGSRRRVAVPFDEALVAETLRYLDDLRETARSGEIPPPLVDSPKCPRCSLVGICLPDEVNISAGRIRKDDVRRLLPARDDALPLYVQEQGASVGKKGERLVVRKGGETIEEVRLLDVSQVSVFGNVSLSPHVLRETCARSIPVCFFSYGGWFYGITHGMGHKNVELRLVQFKVALDREQASRLAARIVAGKIRNARVFLRRNHPEPPAAALAEMQRLAGRAVRTRKLDSLLGIEGAAAKVYFSHFSGMLKARSADGVAVFDFRTRNRRPPRDPINALLSFVYAVLLKDLHVTLLAVGFDPYLGVYHQPRYGRPALALDLMEEFRPVIASSVVLGLVNNGEVRPSDFVHAAGAVALTATGRKKVLAAYERRMDTLVCHPLFGYSISYRRILEVQIRLFARALAGEIPRYPPFAIR